jgi:hypothetical protein
LKTQIITLESHDDLISVRDKLSWAKTPRILLVWPKYAKVTLRLLDLKVLQRHADSLGAQLGLVTRRAKVRRDAESLGIPVFDSTTKAQRDQWTDFVPRVRRIPKTPRRDLRQVRDSVYEKEATWRTSLPGRILTFTAGVIAVLAIAGLFVPRAVLILYPEARTQSVVIPVAASESIESVSVTGLIPARTLSVTVATRAEQSLAITSQISVPKSKSKGVARFTNLSQSEMDIPAGTVVATESSTRFLTLNDTRLPAGIDQFVDIPIEALEAGTQGNVAADTITIVEGSLGLTISVTNPNPLKGGANSKLIGATDEDRARLSEVVMDNLHRDAETKLRTQIAPADLLLMDTFEVVQITEENFMPPAGQPGKTLLLDMQVEFSTRYISDDDLKDLSLSTLNASAENGFEATALPIYKVITDPSTDNLGVSHFELEVTRTLLRQVNEMRVFSIVRGQKPQLIKDELASKLSLRQPPKISIAPSWWPWLPLIPFNISVEVQ